MIGSLVAARSKLKAHVVLCFSSALRCIRRIGRYSWVIVIVTIVTSVFCTFVDVAWHSVVSSNVIVLLYRFGRATGGKEQRSDFYLDLHECGTDFRLWVSQVSSTSCKMLAGVFKTRLGAIRMDAVRFRSVTVEVQCTRKNSNDRTMQMTCKVLLYGYFESYTARLLNCFTQSVKQQVREHTGRLF
jgi:hypothetical protein